MNATVTIAARIPSDLYKEMEETLLPALIRETGIQLTMQNLISTALREYVNKKEVKKTIDFSVRM